jgi:DNA invertase Pin-like site-specific DNA recombinase
MIYGYARASTTDQDTASQVDQLTAAGAVKVFKENISGATADRPQLKKVLAALDAGDMLIVTRIDRLARSTRDLLNIIHDVKQAKATFRSLAEPWADTSSELSEFMLTILAPWRSWNAPRFSAARPRASARAKAQGKSLGRPYKLTPEQQREARAMLAANRGTREIAKVFNVNASTISRLPK